jgi:hypothetical protein
MPGRVERKGLKDGGVTEYVGLFKIKPGRLQQVRDEVVRNLTSRGNAREVYASWSVHDAKYVIFEEEKMILVTISFDQTFDKYFDDALASMDGNMAGFGWTENIEGGPEQIASWTWDEFKNFLVRNQTESLVFANTVSEATVAELREGLRLSKAFQQVLDNPEAAEALRHPALQPLLAEAAG